LFLNERVYALRAPYKRRSQDWIWITSTSLIVVGFGSIIVTGFRWPLARIAENGRCYIGLPRFVVIPLLSYDFFINILLTTSFVYHLGPTLRANLLARPGRRLSTLLGPYCKGKTGQAFPLRTGNAQVADRVEKLLWRTFVGLCLVLLPTIGNLVHSVVVQDNDPGFVCVLLCSCDGMYAWLSLTRFADVLVTWTVAVFHWLAVSSEPDPRSSVELVTAHQRLNSGNTQVQSLTLFSDDHSAPPQRAIHACLVQMFTHQLTQWIRRLMWGRSGRRRISSLARRHHIPQTFTSRRKRTRQ
jgi:hypothetical protein